jgi:hypothetical protein
MVAFLEFGRSMKIKNGAFTDGSTGRARVNAAMKNRR